jgi:hypothetical protein
MAAEQTEIENGSGIGIGAEIETKNQNVIGFEIEIESPREGRRHWLLVTEFFGYCRGTASWESFEPILLRPGWT